MTTKLSRREILKRIAVTGGSVPLVKAMGILGLAHVPEAAFSHDSAEGINPQQGAGKTVAIIGAGLSGLTAA
ncbi:MAG: hypothetical protein GKR95_08290 [Gammaproteobacteria bacterium]|nr:hypothetical protein [Gammaproteobacteria bacterium]